MSNILGKIKLVFLTVFVYSTIGYMLYEARPLIHGIPGGLVKALIHLFIAVLGIAITTAFFRLWKAPKCKCYGCTNGKC